MEKTNMKSISCINQSRVGDKGFHEKMSRGNLIQSQQRKDETEGGPTILNQQKCYRRATWVKYSYQMEINWKKNFNPLKLLTASILFSGDVRSFQQSKGKDTALPCFVLTTKGLVLSRKHRKQISSPQRTKNLPIHIDRKLYADYKRKRILST